MKRTAKNLVLALIGSILLGSAAQAAVHPIEFVQKIEGAYVLTKAKGECASNLVARPVEGRGGVRIAIESPHKTPLTVIRYINRGNVLENVDYWTISAKRVNTTLGDDGLNMIEQRCQGLSCDTNLQVRVRDEMTRTKIVVMTKSVKCEYSK